MESKKRSLRYGLETGVISCIYRDKVNRKVVCLTDLGAFYGSYSYAYYNRVFRSLLMPVPLHVIPVLKDFDEEYKKLFGDVSSSSENNTEV